jgi:hypothetical protein
MPHDEYVDEEHGFGKSIQSMENVYIIVILIWNFDHQKDSN